jgi:hypothetical protein
MSLEDLDDMSSRIPLLFFWIHTIKDSTPIFALYFFPELDIGLYWIHTIKDSTPIFALYFPPERDIGLGFGVVPHGPPVGHLRFLLLSQQRVDVRELLLLLVPLGCILHMIGECMLNFTCTDFQSFEAGVDVVQPSTV